MPNYLKKTIENDRGELMYQLRFK